jgi:hypothetical protein
MTDDAPQTPHDIVVQRNGQRVPGTPRTPRIVVAVVAASTVTAGVVATVHQAITATQ